jgi:hypothetical protein
VITLLKSVKFNILNSVLPIVQDGEIFALPVIATQLTWQTVFVGVPTSITIQILVSSDGVNFNILDSTNFTNGASGTKVTSSAFIRARINAVAAGSCTGVTVSIIAEPGVGGTISDGGSGTVPLHAPTHYLAGSDPVDVKSLAGFTGQTTTFLRADGTFQVPPISGLPGPHASTHANAGSDPVDVKTLGGYPSNQTTFLRGDGTFNPIPAAAPSPHHATHEVGGSDQLVNAAWTNQTNTFTKPQQINTAGQIAALRLNDPGQPANQRLFQLDNQFLEFFIEALDDAAVNSQGYVKMSRTGVFTAPAGLGATPLNASQINSGALPDARLSPNVALKNIDNNFSVSQTLPVESSIKGTNATFYLNDTSAAVNAKFWRIISSGGDLYIDAFDDGFTTNLGRVKVSRTGVVEAASGLGGTPLNASQLTSGIVPDARLSANVQLKPLPANIAYKDIDNSFPTQTIKGSGIAELQLLDTAFGTPVRVLSYQNLFQIYSNALGAGILVANPVNGDVAVLTGLNERGRSTKMGEWVDFTPALSVGVGTITMNNLLTARYTLIGKTMILAMYFNVILSASPTSIVMTIPGGFIASHTTFTALYTNPGSTGTGAIGDATTGAGVGNINFVLIAGAGFSASTQWLAATMTFSIQ